MREHSVIGPLARALGRFAGRIEHFSEDVARSDLTGFVRVFRDLGDCVHHEKEENVLAPFLVRHGFDWSHGPIAEVRLEHQQERYLMEVLTHAASQQGAWGIAEQRHVQSIGLELAAFQQRHLQKENEHWFPAVVAHLDAPALEQLACEMRNFDRQVEGSFPIEELKTLAGQLIRLHANG
jgi:hemerythrin-like domain-containing protein